jgi:hypothetical protein
LVPNDVGVINGIDVNFDENGNVLEYEDVLDDEPNLNICGIDDIAVDLNIWNKGNKKFDLMVQCKKIKKGIHIISQHLNRICDVIESKNTITFKSYDKPRYNIEEVIDVVWGIAENDIDIIKFATEVFLKKSHREIFVTIKESWLQIDFIKRMRNR